MKLLLLRCPHCAFALSPSQHDVVIQCPNCRHAVAINENNLSLITLQYAAPTEAEPPSWLPFWVYLGKVTIKERESQGKKTSSNEADTYWAQPRQIYVPAWNCDLAEARNLTQRLLDRQPKLRALPAPDTDVPFQAAVVTQEDARKLLNLVIISIEAGRSDWMKKLDYDLSLNESALWVLPAKWRGNRWDILLENV